MKCEKETEQLFRVPDSIEKVASQFERCDIYRTSCGCGHCDSVEISLNNWNDEPLMVSLGMSVSKHGGWGNKWQQFWRRFRECVRYLVRGELEYSGEILFLKPNHLRDFGLLINELASKMEGETK